MPAWREWGRLARLQTASLTIAGALLGALAGGARDLLLLAGVAAWGLGFHALGFMHNNLADVEHDRADPSKQLFPLVRGTIPARRAWRVWALLALALYALGLGLTLRAPWGLLALHAGILPGLANNWLAKRSVLARLLIAAAFASVPAVGFFAARPEPGLAALYLAAYGFLLLLHNTAYQGDLKDLGADRVNLLARWGARADQGDGPDVRRYAFPRRVQAFAWGTRLACPALAWAWVATEPQPVWAVALLAAWSAALCVEFRWVVLPGAHRRARKLALMGASELLNYFVLLASLGGLLGALALAFYALPPAWYVLWNRALWGTRLGPRI